MMTTLATQDGTESSANCTEGRSVIRAGLSCPRSVDPGLDSRRLSMAFCNDGKQYAFLRLLNAVSRRPITKLQTSDLIASEATRPFVSASHKPDPSQPRLHDPLQTTCGQRQDNSLMRLGALTLANQRLSAYSPLTETIPAAVLAFMVRVLGRRHHDSCPRTSGSDHTEESNTRRRCESVPAYWRASRSKINYVRMPRGLEYRDELPRVSIADR
jgi:hypothetical protein